MKMALTGVAVAAIALAPLCIPTPQAHADDPCVSITDPAARQACINGLPDDATQRDPMGNCQASPDYGAEGQFCRNFWVRKSVPPQRTAGYAERFKPRRIFEARPADRQPAAAAEKGIESVKTSAPAAKVVDLT
jgi:hypothetical protein